MVIMANNMGQGQNGRGEVVGTEVYFMMGLSVFCEGPKCLLRGAELSFHGGPKCLDINVRFNSYVS